MQIFVKNGAIERHQIQKEVAKPVALKQIKQNWQSEHNKATMPWFKGRVDVAEAAKNAKRLKQNYENVLPETLTPGAKNIMWKRAKALKDEFTVGMLSKDEVHPVRSFKREGKMVAVVDEERMNTSRCVERNTAWYRKNENKLREFKNLMRHLCPEDPSAGDIERFRPRRGV